MSSEFTFTVRPSLPADRPWIGETIRKRWGADRVVGHGTVYEPAALPAYIAVGKDGPVGLITYTIDGDSCEIVTIDSLREGVGVGGRLIENVAQKARAQGCRRLWLITTNDNLPALRFYQKHGFRLIALYPGAVDEARTLKPEIPFIGLEGIPIRDELELEMPLE